jgi:hypothetical protein
MTTHILHVSMQCIIKDEISTAVHYMDDTPQASLKVTSHVELRLVMIVKIHTHLAF